MYEIPKATKNPATVNARQTTEILSDRSVGESVLLVMLAL
jgi:hypothetical protein